jgi:hypothetical protein
MTAFRYVRLRVIIDACLEAFFSGDPATKLGFF